MESKVILWRANAKGEAGKWICNGCLTIAIGNLPSLQQAAGPRVVIGRVAVTRLSSGKFWLEIKDGEGMEIDEAKLEKIFVEIFQREF